MPLHHFLRANFRWVLGAFVLFLCASFGQTYFISLSAGQIRTELGLTHGGFGTLYMAATLCSALTLPHLGTAVDRHAPARVALITLVMLALAAALLALARNAALLFAALYLLRLFGQGMTTHVAFTAMGRWYSLRRGQALSLVTLGMNAGEAMLPLAFVAASAAIGWRGAWWVTGALLLVVATPLVAALFRREPPPEAPAPGHHERPARHWRRPEVLRDPLFYPVVLAMLPPALIGNTVFFHQIHLAELRAWPASLFPSTFVLMAATTVACTLWAGRLVDRHSATVLLPFYLLPMGLACLLLGTVPHAGVVPVFMVLYGVSNGFSLSLFGTLWPELYGTAHLGAIRSAVVSVLVVCSAAGPGLSGLLIDAGAPFPALVASLGLYCLVISAVMVGVARHLRLRATH